MFVASVVGPVVDEEAERDVQPVRLADAASRPPGGADHRQHHGPAREDHDQQSGQQTGERAQGFTFTFLSHVHSSSFSWDLDDNTTRR